ncbi:MAG TPA: GDSL family lipase, partial [Sphingomonas sp.]|nr:GDSL family lipase [Sphingomonas sp.]
MRKAVLAACVTALIGSAASAQIARDPNSKFTTDWNDRLSTDWPYLAKYRAANAALMPSPKHPRIVFMGDSITENWVNLAGDFFTGERIGRGI